MNISYDRYTDYGKLRYKQELNELRDSCACLFYKSNNMIALAMAKQIDDAIRRSNLL